MLPATAAARDEELLEGLFWQSFGTSSFQFAQELKADFERASAEERAEFERYVDQANAVLPELQASVEQMSANVEAMGATIGVIAQSMATFDARISEIQGHLGYVTADKLPTTLPKGVG